MLKTNRQTCQLCVYVQNIHIGLQISWNHFHEKISWKWLVIYKNRTLFCASKFKIKINLFEIYNGATYNFCTIFPFLAHCGVCANYPGMWMDKNLFLLPLLCNVTTQIFFFLDNKKFFSRSFRRASWQGIVRIFCYSTVKVSSEKKVLSLSDKPFF